jgi:hypothetical protein
VDYLTIIKKHCDVCKEEFNTSRKWQLRCSLKCKKIAKQKYHNIYYHTLEKINHRKELSHKAYRENIHFRLSTLIRTRLRTAISNSYRKSKTSELLGCSIQQLKEHLEKQFKPGMNWKNNNVHGWHIDHKIPVSKFDLRKKEEQKKCFHYTNLQPLWCKDNLIKGSKVGDYL